MRRLNFLPGNYNSLDEEVSETLPEISELREEILSRTKISSERLDWEL